jgi:transposase
MEKEIAKRKQAINLWLSGKSPSLIAKDLGLTRQWVYKWIRRYKEHPKGKWYLSESRAPKSKSVKLSHEKEQLIIDIRNRLSWQKYAQVGAISIQYEFYQRGLEPPAVWTINRILSKHGLITKKESNRQPKGIPYPELYFSCQQMDIIGPRYLKGGPRFYVLNIIDKETHTAGSFPLQGKNQKMLLNSLICFWKQFGVPDSLQMDNELVFRGSNKYPRSLGMILRFVLSQHVVPVFIPPSEPWRNGLIERFNGTFEKKFLWSQIFDDFESLVDESKVFIKFHNQNHRYSTQGGKTPAEVQEFFKTSKLEAGYQLPKRIALEEGTIIFVRYIGQDLKIKILGTEFRVREYLEHSYVVAELVIEIHTLRIKQDNIIHHEFEYVMPVDW